MSTAKKLDWRGWMLGIMGAIISGGAGALGSGLGTSVVDPKDFNLTAGFSHVLEVMATSFAISAAFSLAKFLQTHPIPEALTINTSGPVTVTQNTTVNPSSPEAK